MKLNNKTIIAVAIIIILGLVGLIIMIINDKRTTLNIMDEDITKIYNLLGKITPEYTNSSCDGLLSYNNELTTANTLSNAKKLCYAYHNLSTAAFTLNDDKETWPTKNELVIADVTTKSIEEANNKIFGPDSKIEHKTDNLSVSPNLKLKLENDMYSFKYYNNDQTTSQKEHRVLVNAEQARKEIHIYDYYIYLEETYKDGVFSQTCYKDKSKKEVIGECNYGTLKDSYITEHGGYYKHIFKQHKDGTYYWYSSEPSN